MKILRENLLRALTEAIAKAKSEGRDTTTEVVGWKNVACAIVAGDTIEVPPGWKAVTDECQTVNER